MVVFDKNVELDILVQARGSPYRPRHRGPEGLAVRRRPEQPHAGLIIKAAEVVVLQLGSGRQGELVTYDWQLVLDESAVDAVYLFVRKKIHALRCLNEVAGADPGPQAPG